MNHRTRRETDSDRIRTSKRDRRDRERELERHLEVVIDLATD